MPYHKDKQQAFQAAQQGVVQAEHIFNNIVKNDPNYGHDLKQLHQEVQEAYEQIQNALEVASETRVHNLNNMKVICKILCEKWIS